MKLDEIAAVVFIDIAIIIVVARFMGALFKRFRQPPVVGEIVGGIILGPSLLGLFPGHLPLRVFPLEVRPFLTILAQVGNGRTSSGNTRNGRWPGKDRKSTRLNSSHRCLSYAVLCLKKNNELGIHVWQARFISSWDAAGGWIITAAGQRPFWFGCAMGIVGTRLFMQASGVEVWS